MTLQTPKLDDRKFQDIVSEARSKIPLYCPKWTDYNLSDPGITVIEMFAWMVAMLLYRLNRVPDKNYIKFMDLIGIRLEPPKPATVNVTFRLSTPQPEPVTIPQGTEVATVRTETQDAISFTTDRDFTIMLPKLSYALTTPDDNVFTDINPVLKNPDRQVSVFQDVPKENNALYLGYDGDLAAYTLVLTFESNIEGIGVNPKNPPWAWEFWDGDYERWLPIMGGVVIVKSQKFEAWINPGEPACVLGGIQAHEAKHISDFEADSYYSTIPASGKIADGHCVYYQNNADAKKFENAAIRPRLLNLFRVKM